MNSEAGIFKILRFIIQSIIFIGSIFFIAWIGIKGILGILFGFVFMAIMIFSKNPMMMFFVKKFQATWYMDMMQEKKKK